MNILPVIPKIYERLMYDQMYILINSSLNFKVVSVKDLTLKTVSYIHDKNLESLDQEGHYGALLTDLLKAFDYIMHDLLMAELQAYGFDNDSLNFICNYLLGREQGIKINSSFSTWSKTEYGVPLESILGPLLLNINTLDMFFEQKDVNFAAYADDNTLYFCDKKLEVFSVSFRYVH